MLHNTAICHVMAHLVEETLISSVGPHIVPLLTGLILHCKTEREISLTQCDDCSSLLNTVTTCLCNQSLQELNKV